MVFPNLRDPDKCRDEMQRMARHSPVLSRVHISLYRMGAAHITKLLARIVELESQLKMLGSKVRLLKSPRIKRTEEGPARACHSDSAGNCTWWRCPQRKAYRMRGCIHWERALALKYGRTDETSPSEASTLPASPE